MKSATWLAACSRAGDIFVVKQRRFPFHAGQSAVFKKLHDVALRRRARAVGAVPTALSTMRYVDEFSRKKCIFVWPAALRVPILFAFREVGFLLTLEKAEPCESS